MANLRTVLVPVAGVLLGAALLAAYQHFDSGTAARQRASARAIPEAQPAPVQTQIRYIVAPAPAQAEAVARGKAAEPQAPPEPETIAPEPGADPPQTFPFVAEYEAANPAEDGFMHVSAIQDGFRALHSSVANLGEIKCRGVKCKFEVTFADEDSDLSTFTTLFGGPGATIKGFKNVQVLPRTTLPNGQILATVYVTMNPPSG